MTLLFAALLFLQPDAAQPTPQQVSAADLAGKTAALENVKLELERTREETWWAVLKTALGAAGGAGLVVGGAAKWLWGARLDKLKLDHVQEIELKTLQHQQAIELTRVTAETKKTANDDDLQKLRDDFKELEKRCLDEEKKCAEALSKVSERLSKEESKSDGFRDRLQEYREQLLVLQAMRKRSSFSGWTVNFDRRIVDVTPACERQILVPLGKRRDQVERQFADHIWPPPLAKLTMFLDEEARVRPGHIAAAMNVVIHPSIPPLMVAKVLATDSDGHAHGIEGIAIPMSAFVDVPPELLEATETDLTGRTPN